MDSFVVSAATTRLMCDPVNSEMDITIPPVSLSLIYFSLIPFIILADFYFFQGAFCLNGLFSLEFLRVNFILKSVVYNAKIRFFVTDFNTGDWYQWL